MLLWNDYEGKTIAGSYPLEKLLRPEGRSAFFTTFNGTGTPAVIRLIESLNDEQEILARWRTVTEIKQPELLTLRTCGEDIIDGTPIIYAVLEPTDANLADVLSDRPLSVEETRQVATSLVAALQALHARNLIHEHIEPANVLAAGEVIKLRSDCIRDVPDGLEAYEGKVRDTRDLAILMLQARTLHKEMREGDAALLTAPLAEIVRNGMSGEWGLSEIAAALYRLSPQPKIPVKAQPIPRVQAAPSVEKPQTSAVGASTAATTATTTTPVREYIPLAESDPGKTRRNALVAASVIAAILLVFLIVRAARHPSAPAEPAVAATAQSQSAAIASSAATPEPAPAKPSATSPVIASTGRSAHTDWHVIAYTYNHASQAQSKVDAIAAKHSSLKPEVFTPNGLAPYLVTLGGAMTREEAMAMRKQALSSGLANDTYVQNYSGRSH